MERSKKKMPRECLCYDEYIRVGRDFKKIVDLEDSGLMIYHHDDRAGTASDPTGDKANKLNKETSNKQNDDAFIVHKTRDVEINPADLVLQLDTNKITCRRCKTMYEQAQKILQNIPRLNRNIMGICIHCYMKAQYVGPCKKCTNIVKKFVATKDEHHEDKKMRTNTWLSKVNRFLDGILADDAPKNLKSRANLEEYINDLRETPSQTTFDRSEVKRPFRSKIHLSDSDITASVSHICTEIKSDLKPEKTLEVRKGKPSHVKKEQSLAVKKENRKVMKYSTRYMQDKYDIRTFDENPTQKKKYVVAKYLHGKPSTLTLSDHHRLKKLHHSDAYKHKTLLKHQNKIQSDESMITTISKATKKASKEDLVYFFPKDIKENELQPKSYLSSSTLIVETRDKLKGDEEYIELNDENKLGEDNKLTTNNNRFTSDNKKFASNNNKFASDNNKFTSDNNKFASDNNKFTSDNNKFGSDNNKFASDKGLTAKTKKQLNTPITTVTTKSTTKTNKQLNTPITTVTTKSTTKTKKQLNTPITTVTTKSTTKTNKQLNTPITTVTTKSTTKTNKQLNTPITTVTTKSTTKTNKQLNTPITTVTTKSTTKTKKQLNTPITSVTTKSTAKSNKQLNTPGTIVTTKSKTDSDSRKEQGLKLRQKMSNKSDIQKKLPTKKSEVEFTTPKKITHKPDKQIVKDKNNFDMDKEVTDFKKMRELQKAQELKALKDQKLKADQVKDPRNIELSITQIKAIQSGVALKLQAPKDRKKDIRPIPTIGSHIITRALRLNSEAFDDPYLSSNIDLIELDETSELVLGEKLFMHKPLMCDKLSEPNILPSLFQTFFNSESALGDVPSSDDVVPRSDAALKASRSQTMNVYRMRPARPELNWFENNKNKARVKYDSGERLAAFDDNGRGRWYYRNGRLALDYYKAEETNAQQRFVVYSSGEPDERGRKYPITVLAAFDYSGNGVVFDHTGKIRLKYNQTEGVVLDRGIGPVSHWKWHALNDPPVLQQVMIDTETLNKDPFISKLGLPTDNQPRPDNEEMLAIEFENFIKEKERKLAQEYKPFQIKMKALKINEHFSLRVLDQATVYLIFRDGLTSFKLNVGMLLDHHEIVDTDTAEMGEVTNNVERLPARSNSLAGLRSLVTFAQRHERARTERHRKQRLPEPSSADKLTAGLSPRLRCPVRTVSEKCYCNRKPSTKNLYYDTRII